MRHTGITDVPLTDHGRAQASALATYFTELTPVLVLCSPRSRARDTAELARLTPYEIDENLAEWNYGSYEGVTTAQIREDQPGWTVWTDPVPGGETRQQVGARADQALARARAALPDGDVVAVSHGHLGRVLAARWLGLSPAQGRLLALGPATPCVLGHEHGVPVLTRWNVPNPADGGRL